MQNQRKPAGRGGERHAEQGFDRELDLITAQTEGLLRRIYCNKSISGELLEIIVRLGRPACLSPVVDSVKKFGLIVVACGEQVALPSGVSYFTITSDHVEALSRIDLQVFGSSLAEIAFVVIWSLEGCCVVEASGIS
ncbi:MAG: hypothetical protein NTV57_18725 [Cyanobacteria bacterium]|nr:hypothetical protein [Cyanobacteriota bacterium]